jgi:uncharacterized repeat protein (TIGR01451 family)
MDVKRVGGAKVIRAIGVMLVSGMAAGLVPPVSADPHPVAQSPTAYADLAVFVSDGRASLAGPGAETTYVITVTNAGPAAVVGASIEDTLPPNLSGAVWGCLPQEEITCSIKGSGDLSDQFDLPAGASAIYLLTATLETGTGTTVTNLVHVTAAVDFVDPVSANDTAVDVNGIGVAPALSVSDVAVSLHSSGPATASVRIDLESALPYSLTVDFATADDSALADADYTPRTGSLTLAAGATSGTVEVEVLPTGEGGLDRRFFVDFKIASPSGIPDLRANVVASWPSGFYALRPCRLVDTRSGDALAASATRRIGVAGHCGIPTTARTIAANVTVAGATAAGDLRVSAAGLATPQASSVNYAPGRTRAAQAMVALSLEGEIDVYPAQAGGTADLVLDVAGYFK